MTKVACSEILNSLVHRSDNNPVSDSGFCPSRAPRPRAEASKTKDLSQQEYGTALATPTKLSAVRTASHNCQIDEAPTIKSNRVWNHRYENHFPIRSAKDPNVLNPLFSATKKSTKLSQQVNATFEYHVAIPDDCLKRMANSKNFKGQSEAKIRHHVDQQVKEIVEAYLDNQAPNFARHYVDRVSASVAKEEPALKNQQALYVDPTIETGQIICAFIGVYGNETLPGDESYSLQTLSGHIISPGGCAGAFANTAVRYCEHEHSKGKTLEYDPQKINAFFLDAQVSFTSNKLPKAQLFSLVFLLYVEAPRRLYHDNGKDLDVRVDYGSALHLKELQEKIERSDSINEQKVAAIPAQSLPSLQDLFLYSAPPRRSAAIRADNNMRAQQQQESLYDQEGRKRPLSGPSLQAPKRVKKSNPIAKTITILDKQSLRKDAPEIVQSAMSLKEQLKLIVNQAQLNRYYQRLPDGVPKDDFIYTALQRVRRIYGADCMPEFLLQKFPTVSSKVLAERLLKAYEKIVDQAAYDNFVSHYPSGPKKARESLYSWVQRKRALNETHRIPEFLAKLFPPQNTPEARAKMFVGTIPLRDAARLKYSKIVDEASYNLFIATEGKGAITAIRSWVNYNRDRDYVSDFLKQKFPPPPETTIAERKREEYSEIKDRESYEKFINNYHGGRAAGIATLTAWVRGRRERGEMRFVTDFLAKRFPAPHSIEAKRSAAKNIQDLKKRNHQRALNKYSFIVDEASYQQFLANGGKRRSLRVWVGKNRDSDAVPDFLKQKFPPMSSSAASALAAKNKYSSIIDEDSLNAFIRSQPISRAACMTNISTWVNSNCEKGVVTEFLLQKFSGRKRVKAYLASRNNPMANPL